MNAERAALIRLGRMYQDGAAIALVLHAALWLPIWSHLRGERLP